MGTLVDTAASIVGNSPVRFTGKSQQIFEMGRIGFRAGEFYWPQFMDVSPTGDILVADTDNNRLQGFNAYSLDSLFSPYGVYGNGNGNLISPTSIKLCPIRGIDFVVTDTGNKRLVFFKLDGVLRQVDTWGQTEFGKPQDVTVDSNREVIYVTDSGKHRVTIHRVDGYVIGECQSFFDQPSGICMDCNDRILVCDSGNHCIKVFDINGNFIESIGCFGQEPGQFDHPKAICRDRRGYIFIADQGNNRVQMFTPDGKFLSVVVDNIPSPSGLAVHQHLLVSTRDQYAFIKGYAY